MIDDIELFWKKLRKILSSNGVKITNSANELHILQIRINSN